MKTALILILITGQLMAADPISDALQKGLFEEEANHNLDAAIKAYQSVIDQTAEQRKLTATAVFRLGECYRKLNKTNEAIAQYHRVVREFADMASLVTLSQQNLAGLAMASADTGLSAATSAEAKEIERISAMVKFSPDLLNAPGEPSGMTPLGAAAFNGHLAVARFLLDNKAEIDARDRNGYTALHRAADAGHKTMVELLLDRGANVNPAPERDNQPLHLATRKGYRSIVEVLLARKAEINARGESGRTPLHLAVWRPPHVAIAKALLDGGANVNAQDDEGSTPLHYVVSSPELTKLILSYKPNLESTDREGITALIKASLPPGDIRSLELLLKARGDVNKATPHGFTPLMAAITRPDPNKVRLLLEHKADPNEKWSGGSPLALALDRAKSNIAEADRTKFAEIADLLRKYGGREYANSTAPQN